MNDRGRSVSELERKLISEALNISKWEKIDSGVHNFKLSKVEYRLTDKSKRQAIVYSGTILNSKGMEQVVNVVDIVDNEEGFKFGAARLIQFINHFGGNADSVESMDDLISIANKFVNNVIKLEFVKKLINGITIKEKEFIFNKR